MERLSGVTVAGPAPMTNLFTYLWLRVPLFQYDSWGDIGTDAFGYLVALDNWGVGSEDNNFTQIDAGFTLYPNPADSEITVFADVSEDWNVSIYSSNGQEVLAEEILGKIKVINVSSLSPGNYVIAARSHRGHIGSSQLIVE